LQTKRSHIRDFCLSLPAGAVSGIAAGGARFRRHEHLKRRVDIARVFKKGRVASCPGIKLFFLVNGLANNRIVITFARKYGNAVQRNRARRLSREAYRLMKGELEPGYDLVLLLCAPVGEFKRGSLAERNEQLKTLFEKAGMRRMNKKL